MARDIITPYYVRNVAGNYQDKEVLVALYAYESRADGDLSFKKGDIMFLLDQSNCDWWYVKHQRTGSTGYVPRNFVAKQQTIESEDKTRCERLNDIIHASQGVHIAVHNIILDTGEDEHYVNPSLELGKVQKQH